MKGETQPDFALDKNKSPFYILIRLKQSTLVHL